MAELRSPGNAYGRLLTRKLTFELDESAAISDSTETLGYQLKPNYFDL